MIIAPSILSADFCRLGEEIAALEKAGADWIHVDVMDGRFVPNITMGPQIVKAVRSVTKLPIDTHLMIVEPERWIEKFAEAGSDIITVQAEACVHLDRTLASIKEAGKKAGVALNPASHEDLLAYVLDKVDLVLVMSVNPGFGGQSFIDAAIPKISRIRALLDAANNQHCLIEVDGGINAQTAPKCLAAGANVLVAGNAILCAADYAQAIKALRENK